LLGSIDARAKMNITFPHGVESVTWFRTSGRRPASSSNFEFNIPAMLLIMFEVLGASLPSAGGCEGRWGAGAAIARPMNKTKDTNILIVVERKATNDLKE